MKKIIHIGAPKTGTTTLQNTVFPILEEHNICKFNPPSVLNDIHEIELLYSYGMLGQVSGIDMGNKPVFISKESLLGWNPSTWESRRDLNLKLFGSDSIIVITLREPLSHLTSYYQQTIHGGIVKDPRDFFLDSITYKNMRLGFDNHKYYDIDSFCIKRLIHLYSSSFDQVYVVPMESLFEFQFLKSIFNISDYVQLQLKKAMVSSGKHNRSYSKAAMAITFRRERFLALFGLKSIGNDDHFEKLGLSIVRGKEITATPFSEKKDSSCDGISEKKQNHHFSKISYLFRLCTHLIKRITKEIIAPLSNWRYFIQNHFDRIISYEKYQLPSGLYLGVHHEQNCNSYQELIKRSKDKGFVLFSQKDEGKNPSL